jgi:hypothetical protein
MDMIKKCLLILVAGVSFLYSQSSRYSAILDDCTDAALWRSFQSAGVEVRHQDDDGSVRFDVKFHVGSGYGGIFRNFSVPFPEQYEISFLMKSTVPVNNFEVKVSSDTAGENIWWVNKKNYTYSAEWKRITIKKRHLSFAWGPNQAPHPLTLRRLEIVVTAGSGGEGSVWIDDIRLTSLPPTPSQIPVPSATASSFQKKNGNPSNVLPNKIGGWKSRTGKNEWIELDLKYDKEFGAVLLDWDRSMKSLSYDILSSMDGKKYEKLHSVVNGSSGKVFHFLPESEARYIRLQLKGNTANIPFHLEQWDIIASKDLSTPNHFYEYIAASSPAGFYPRYYLKQQNYWTVVGVPSDTREALFGEDGSVEVDRQRFSVEPFVVLTEGTKVLHWGNGKNEQTLEENYLPIPTVVRSYDDISLRTTVFAAGEPEQSAILVRYIVNNISRKSQQGSLYLALRPFQVNPSSQWLNYDGGFAGISSIQGKGNRAIVGDKSVVVSGSSAEFGASAREQGDIVDFIARHSLPVTTASEHDHGMTSGAFRFPFTLEAGYSLTVILAVPFTPEGDRWTENIPTVEEFDRMFAEVSASWKRRLNTVEFSGPKTLQRYIDIIRSNLAYILINKDRYGFQPGSRSYERSWIRDGSMTSDALLKLGITEEPKQYLNWYAAYQYDNGAVPCVVDTRGPDPVPEHDSHGQLIFALMEYFRFTGDTAFLSARWQNVVAAVEFIQSLRAQRMTAEYRDGDDEKRALYGLVTESISHEGYSDKPMHSYWDNFFVLKGFKDAASIAHVLGKGSIARKYDSLAQSFRTDLYASIALAMKNRNIDFIPGCVEKGDFDPTSTSIALFPNGEMKHVPQPAFNSTFEKYFTWFMQRARGEISWDAYTPYEIRNVGTFVYLGQKERAHQVMEYFLNDLRPLGWNHWAEVVANGYRTQRFIGDMPHTWVGSDYINAIRAMFAYEIDDDHALVLGAGLKREWVLEGCSVNNLPTHYGMISYAIAPVSATTIKIILSGTVDTQRASIRIPADIIPKKIKNATVNGVAISPSNRFITIRTLPAEILIESH